MMTGPIDIVSNGRATYLLRNGDPIQTRVTGVSPPCDIPSLRFIRFSPSTRVQIGCVLSSVIAATLAGAFGAAEEITAVIAAVSAFNIAAEKANAAPKPAGPASWAVRFLDILAGPQSGFENEVKIEEITV